MNSETEARPRRRGPSKRVWIALILAALPVLFIGLGYLVVWLWANTVSDLFGWKEISFWQAWGLILLSQILFKANLSSGGGSGSSSNRKKRAAAPMPEAGGAA